MDGARKKLAIAGASALLALGIVGGIALAGDEPEQQIDTIQPAADLGDEASTTSSTATTEATTATQAPTTTHSEVTTTTTTAGRSSVTTTTAAPTTTTSSPDPAPPPATWGHSSGCFGAPADEPCPND